MDWLGAADARILLIATGTHHTGLPSVRAALNSVTDLGRTLVERCGLAEHSLRILRDPASPTEMGIAIAEEADPRPGRVAHTALAYAAVRNSLLDSSATTMVVVLDCCFSGRALDVLGAESGDEAEVARVHGGFVLTSSARDELALAPPGQQHTALSGELIRLLVEGDQDGPPLLTLGHAYRYLSKILPAKGFSPPPSPGERRTSPESERS